MSTNNTNLENFIKNFNNHFAKMENGVKEGKWAFNYDEKSDVLYFSPKGVSFTNESILIPAGETCISARVSQDGSIEGLVVDEFGSVFVPQNAEFKKFYNTITRKNAQIEPVTLRRAWALLLSDLSSAMPRQTSRIATA